MITITDPEMIKQFHRILDHAMDLEIDEYSYDDPERVDELQNLIKCLALFDAPLAVHYALKLIKYLRDDLDDATKQLIDPTR